MTDTPEVNAGYVKDNLYLFFPSDNGFHYRKQSGGVMCHQNTLQGFTCDLGRPTINRGFPDWMPETSSIVPKDKRHPNATAYSSKIPEQDYEILHEWVADTEHFSDWEEFIQWFNQNNTGGLREGETHPIADVDLSTIPEHDYETLPEWVQERGHFYNWDEFSQWLDQDNVWRHSHIDLIDELVQWNYAPEGIDGMSNAPDMTERWDSLDDIWAAINEVLPFEYENHTRFPMNDSHDFDDFDHLEQDVPKPCEGIRWITITDGPAELEGETCLLLFPNCD